MKSLQVGRRRLDYMQTGRTRERLSDARQKVQSMSSDYGQVCVKIDGFLVLESNLLAFA